MNADERVMEYFPSVLSKKESDALVGRFIAHFDQRAYTYFAVDQLVNNEFIGFIGLAYQEYDTDFNPSVDIGWRLKYGAWGKGFATEGARKCLDYGFGTLNLPRINAIATVGNDKSTNVMDKIGMKRMKSFEHPKLLNTPDYKNCWLYAIENHNFSE